MVGGGRARRDRARRRVDRCRRLRGRPRPGIPGQRPGHPPRGRRPPGWPAPGCTTCRPTTSSTGRAGRPYTEWDTPNPLSVYGRSKLAGEAGARAGRRRRAHVVAVRPLRPQLRQDDRSSKARAGGELRVVDDQHGCFTFADRPGRHDPPPGPRSGARALFHVTNQGPTTWYGLARDALRGRRPRSGRWSGRSRPPSSTRPARRPGPRTRCSTTPPSASRAPTCSPTATTPSAAWWRSSTAPARRRAGRRRCPDESRSRSSAPATSASPPPPASPTSATTWSAPTCCPTGSSGCRGARSRSSRRACPSWCARAWTAAGCRSCWARRAAAAGCEFAYLCVPTPQGDDGAADLSYIRAAARTRSAPCSSPSRWWSTSRRCPWAPRGSSRRPSAVTTSAVVSNPEFLREGSAVHDFLHPDRIVIGAEDQVAAGRVAAAVRRPPGARHRHRPGLGGDDQVRVQRLPRHQGLVRQRRRQRVRGASAPTSATSCSAWATTSASASSSCKPGPGWGGSCFPKDTSALLRTAEDAGYDFGLLRGVREVNEEQFERVAEKVVRLAGGSLDGRVVAAWGLTFKARTDDLRESPALEVLGPAPRPGRPHPGLRPQHRAAAATAPVLDGIDLARRPLRGVRGGGGARRPHRVGRVPLGRLRQGGGRSARPLAWSTPATSSTRPPSGAWASSTRESAVDAGRGRGHGRRRLPGFAPLPGAARPGRRGGRHRQPRHGHPRQRRRPGRPARSSPSSTAT